MWIPFQPSRGVLGGSTLQAYPTPLSVAYAADGGTPQLSTDVDPVLGTVQYQQQSRATFTYTVPSTQVFSLTMWLRCRYFLPGAYASICESRTDSLVGLICTSANKLSGSWNNTAGEYDNANAFAITLERTYLAALVVNGTSETIYCYSDYDGLRSDTQTISATSRGPSVWDIGSDSSTGGRTAYMDYGDLCIYPARALSETDIRAKADLRTRWDLYWTPSPTRYLFVGAAAGTKAFPFLPSSRRAMSGIYVR